MVPPMACSELVNVFVDEARKGTYAHAKGTTEIVEDDIGTGIASVIHYVWLAVKEIKGIIKKNKCERSEDTRKSRRRWLS